MLYSILVAIDVLLAIAIIGLVLIQHGKGADAGAAFGSGASGTVFGAQGSASFLTKLTTVLAVLFFANSLWLAHLASNRPVAESVIDAVEEVQTETSEIETPQSEISNIDVPDDSGVGEVSVEDSQTESATEDLLNDLEDSAVTIKEDVVNTLEDITPDDVPE